MNEEDFSLCISCAYAETCCCLNEDLLAYQCDAYMPKESENVDSSVRH